jgi:hypothetical protein
MTSQDRESQNGKLFVGAALAGLVFATLFCKLDGAAVHSCQFLGNAFWAALGVLRLGLVAARWYGVAAYLYENSRLVEHLLQVGASAWPSLSAIRWLGIVRIS